MTTISRRGWNHASSDQWIWQKLAGAISRINLERKLFDLVAINDINPDPNNVAYLLKYDSTYGRLGNDVIAQDGYLHVNGDRNPALLRKPY